MGNNNFDYINGFGPRWFIVTIDIFDLLGYTTIIHVNLNLFIETIQKIHNFLFSTLYLYENPSITKNVYIVGCIH